MSAEVQSIQIRLTPPPSLALLAVTSRLGASTVSGVGARSAAGARTAAFAVVPGPPAAVVPEPPVAVAPEPPEPPPPASSSPPQACMTQGANNIALAPSTDPHERDGVAPPRV